MDTNIVMQVAAKAGRIILENGGETYRVEETIIRICNAYGLKNCESYVTPTGIMISANDPSGNIISLVKRITKRTIDLEKISKVNDLSRNINANHLTVQYVEKELNRIYNLNRYNTLFTLMGGALVAGFFTLLFGGNFLDFIVSLVIGILIKGLSMLLTNIGINEFFINAIGGALASLLALISVNLSIADNVDKIIIGAIMLLVPGLAITNAIRDTIAGDLVAGLSRGAEALLIAIAIAVGSGITFTLWISYVGGI